MYRVQTFEELRELTVSCRNRWGIKGNRFDLLNILRTEFPKEFPRFRLEVIPNDKWPEVTAFADHARRTIGIKAYLEGAAEKLDPRATNILAEETGHFLCHPGQRFRKLDDVVARSDEQIGIQEREAKLFSALLIAPVEDCRNCRTVDDLIGKFCLEEDVASIYLEELVEYRRKQTGLKKEIPDKVVDITRELAARGSRSSPIKEPRFNLTTKLDAPSEFEWVTVDIRISPSAGRAEIHGFVKGGGTISYDVDGTQTRYRLPFVNNQIFVRYIRLVQSFEISVVDWGDLKVGANASLLKLPTAPSIVAKAKGYEGVQCPECREFNVIHDGNCFTCECGWSTSVS